MLEDFVKNKAKQNTPYPAIDFEVRFDCVLTNSDLDDFYTFLRCTRVYIISCI